MVAISKEQFDAAKKADAENGPLVTGVRYRRTSRKIEVEYENGVAISVPVILIQELRLAGDVSQADLADVQVWAGGRAVYFSRIEVSVWGPGLLKGIFGTKAWMRELARGMGSLTSSAKAIAARENGKKGGRPRKLPAEADTPKRRSAATRALIAQLR